MLSKTALDVLELRPVWRLREPVSQQCWFWPVNGPYDRYGALVMPQAPVGVAAQLLDNLVLALGVQAGEPQEVGMAELPGLLLERGAGWVWWLGDAVAPDWQSCVGVTLLAGPSLETMLADPQAKSRVWQDWCAWMAGLQPR